MIEVRGLEFQYDDLTFRLTVPDLRVQRGEKIALIGPSGSGKTTLINLIAGILSPHDGSIRVADMQLAQASDRALRNFRISQIGFVFQEFELLDYLTVRDNILLPYYLNATLELNAEVARSATALAESMGIADKLTRRPATLSHGERQRVAICRALITGPPLLLADEPTGNLDPKTADMILSLLLGEAENRNATLLMVTHNHGLLSSFDRTIDVNDFANGGRS